MITETSQHRQMAELSKAKKVLMCCKLGIKMTLYLLLVLSIFLTIADRPIFAEDFNLSSPFNKGTFRFEIDNDAIWKEDSNFSNGWSLQYHTVRYPTWDATKAPGFIKWVGNHFPTLNDDESIVRYGQGIGQNMITPGDIGNPDPPPGDLPYAGTLTYSLNWQRFNPQTASVFQVSMGVMGEESLAEEFQRFIHVDLGIATDPQGWHTQRDSEPILNIGYAYFWNLAFFGDYTNDWAVQLMAAPAVLLGNLSTELDFGVALRCGWNIQEGFNAFPAPPGKGLFLNSLIPKPKNASPHGVELILSAKAVALAYSVIYDGSFITSDDRDVDRETFGLTGLIGVNYHYYKFMTIRIAFIRKTDVLKEESLPPPRPGEDSTGTDNSYGTLMIDFHF